MLILIMRYWGFVRTLADTVMELVYDDCLTLGNSGSATFLRRTSRSVLDFYYFPVCSWKMLDCGWNSDHFSIKFCVPYQLDVDLGPYEDSLIRSAISRRFGMVYFNWVYRKMNLDQFKFSRWFVKWGKMHPLLLALNVARSRTLGGTLSRRKGTWKK